MRYMYYSKYMYMCSNIIQNVLCINFTVFLKVRLPIRVEARKIIFCKDQNFVGPPKKLCPSFLLLKIYYRWAEVSFKFLSQTQRLAERLNHYEWRNGGMGGSNVIIVTIIKFYC